MANKIYIAPETAITFSDSGGDAVITLANLAAGVGRISARYDLGASSRSIDYEWRATMRQETNGVLDEVIELYISTSDGTNPDGENGAVDAALTVARLVNMKQIGAVVVDTTTADSDMTASGVITIAARYFSVVVYNNTVDNLKNTAAVSSVIFTPIPAEVQ